MNELSSDKEILLDRIKNIFKLEEDIVNEMDYKSYETLNEAFSNNVMWCDPDRKKDAALIFYSLINILQNNLDVDKLYNFEIFLSDVMPYSWKFHWENTDVKPINRYLATFTKAEALVVLACLQYIYIFCCGVEKTYLDDVIQYWREISYNREKLTWEAFL